MAGEKKWNEIKMKWKWSQIAGEMKISGEMQSRDCGRAVGHQSQPGGQRFPSVVLFLTLTK